MQYHFFAAAVASPTPPIDMAVIGADDERCLAVVQLLDERAETGVDFLRDPPVRRRFSSEVMSGRVGPR